RYTGWVKSRVRILNLRKANFRLFRALVCGIPWETALGIKGVNESWEIWKDIFLRAQELSILMGKKSGRGGRRPAWLTQDLLAKLKHKTKMHRKWRHGYTSWVDYRDMAQECRKGIRKAKAQLELNLARDVKNKKCFFRYIGQQRKMKETVPTLMSKMGDLATSDVEKAEVLNNFFALIFSG
ncbi:hypothetical protein N327_13538, partial [Fulmarus glacialis]